VIKIQDRVFVVDVTIRHEDGDTLDRARRSKLEKYAPKIQELKRRLGAEDGEVVPTVIGTRGAMPTTTIHALRKLNITTKQTLYHIIINCPT
jgi:hypothetical protein